MNGAMATSSHELCNITELVDDKLSYHVLTQSSAIKHFWVVFVGRLESIVEDASALFGRAIEMDLLLKQVPELSKYFAKDVEADRYTSNAEEAKALMNPHLLASSTLKLVQEYYQQDFSCFGE